MIKPFKHHSALSSHPNMVASSNPASNEYYFRFTEEQKAIDLITSIACHYRSTLLQDIYGISTVIYLPSQGQTVRMKRLGQTHVLCKVDLEQTIDRDSKSNVWYVAIKPHTCFNGRLEDKYENIGKYWLPSS